MIAEFFPDTFEVFRRNWCRSYDEELGAKRTSPRIRLIEQHVLEFQFAFEHSHRHSQYKEKLT
jgi:hypothetical protein